jgi:hypothetical protein
MTTPAVTPNLESELSAYVHKVLYAHFGVIVLMLVLMGAGGYFGLRSYDKALAHAEALQIQFNTAQAQAAASQKQLTDLLAADSAQRAKESAQQATLEQQIINRNAQAPSPAVQTALQPSANAESLVLGLGASYSDVPNFGTPKVDTEGNIALSVPQARSVLVGHENEKRLGFDLQAETGLFTLETSKSTSLSNDLAQCKATVSQDETALVDAKKSIAAYKKLAVRSRWQKFLGGVEKVALVAVGFEIGHKF